MTKKDKLLVAVIVVLIAVFAVVVWYISTGDANIFRFRGRDAAPRNVEIQTQTDSAVGPGMNVNGENDQGEDEQGDDSAVGPGMN